MKPIYLAFVIILVSVPILENSYAVAFPIDVDRMVWDAFIPSGSEDLCNDKTTASTTICVDQIRTDITWQINDLNWQHPNGNDRLIKRFEAVGETFWTYIGDPFDQPSTSSEDGVSGLVASHYFSFELGQPIHKWDCFLYDVDTHPAENKFPNLTTVLLLCFGLIGLAGFARKWKKDA